jgi:CHAD domain-containing protein
VVDAQQEVESKFDVAPDFVLGDLQTLIRPGETLATSHVELISSYYDTDRGDLLSSRLTLRQRTGDDDTGWHLKVPGDGFRTELRWPLTESGQLPPELSRLIEPFSHSTAVREQVRLRSHRTRHRIANADGMLRLDIADDEVWATPQGSPVTVPRWREVEVELGPAGTNADLAEAAGLLVERGAFSSTSSSKLARALYGLPNPEDTPDTAGTALLRYLQAQFDTFTAGHFAISIKPFEPEATAEPHEAVHQTRVAIRRVRSALRTFAPLFDKARAASLDAELGWLAAELGELRDREVLRARLLRAVDDLPAYLVVGPVAERIDQVLLTELTAHADALVRTMRESRYHSLVDEMTQWRQAPPFTSAADKPVRSLSDHVAAAERRLARRMKRAAARHASESDLHSARKAGKRARYAAEAVAPTLGKRVDSLAKSAANLQSLLGEHQDSIVATELLRRIADEVADEGQNAFTYGILVADQRRSAADSARAAHEAATRRASIADAATGQSAKG